MKKLLKSENQYYPAVIWNIKNGIIFMDLMESNTAEVLAFLKVNIFTQILKPFVLPKLPIFI